MPFTATEFGKKLLALREGLDNTIEEVSSATAIVPARLRGMENGDFTPTGDEVLILADYFKSDFPWLIEDDEKNPDENVTMLLRSEGGRLSKLDRIAITEFLHMCKSQALLDDLLENRKNAETFFYQPKGRSFKNHGSECAHAFRERHKLQPSRVILDIFDWLRGTGLRVFRRYMPNSIVSGLFVNHPYAGRCILINADEDEYRQRFSAAHETGHALLDSEREFNISLQGDNSDDNRHEIRANSFASNFLMPPELLRILATPEQWQSPKVIKQGASRLAVSVPALLSALVRDKILTNQTRNNIRAMKIKLPDKIDPELEGLNGLELKRMKILLNKGLHMKYVDQAFQAYNKELISMSKLAEILLVETSELNEIASTFGTTLHHG